MNNLYSINEYYQILRKRGFVAQSVLAEGNSTDIKYVTYDSNQVIDGTLFICKGAAFKEEYLQSALSSGAICYVSEKMYDTSDYPNVSCIIVSDVRKSMAIIANMFFNKAWNKLNMTGITGTKGKTTSAYYIKAILDDYEKSQAGTETAIISSVDTYDGKVLKESHITTPEAVELHEHFNNAVEKGISYLTMEVSSQALKYDRVDELSFDVGIFMNISPDHISPIEHKDFEDYFASKLLIFKSTKCALVNMDSDFSERIYHMAVKNSERVITFGTKQGVDIYGYDIKKDDDEIVFKVRCDRFDEEIRLTMPGLFNVENALAAIATAYVYNIPFKFIHSGLYKAKSSGRMEKYTSHDGKVVAIVDYAHNKLSFEKLFESTLKEYPGYEMQAMFGCPGKKAFLRRKDLGTLAGRYCDYVYLVAEDPGEEPVIDISKDIAQYVEAENCPYEMIEDRGEAICKAIRRIEKNTVILITGKGNETRQKYGREYLDCPSDVEFVKKYLNEYNKSHTSMLGILGGMGPASSAFFYERITNRTRAKFDQEHLDIVLYSHASMPDRTEAIMSGNTEDMANEFVKDVQMLERMGVGNIAIPCNTSHVFFDRMQGAVNTPIINMVEETVKYIANSNSSVKNIGIMATDGTLKSKVYKNACDHFNVGYIEPEADTQEDIMYIIYSEIKKGKTGSEQRFNSAVEALVEKGADAVILACTELSVYKEYHDVPDVCVDAMDVLTSEAISRSGYREI